MRRPGSCAVIAFLSLALRDRPSVSSLAGSISNTYGFAFRSLILLKCVGGSAGRELPAGKPREEVPWLPAASLGRLLHGQEDSSFGSRQHGQRRLTKGLSFLNLDQFFKVLGDLLATDLC